MNRNEASLAQFPDLFSGCGVDERPPPDPDDPRPRFSITTRTITERFERFHEENPHVYDEIVRLARVARSRGRDRWSINGIFEVLRWSRMVTGGDDFKLSNDYRALYAREVMRREPDLDGFFSLRTRSTL